MAKQDNDPKRGEILGESLGIAEKEIVSGMIVSYTDPATGDSGWYRVRKATKNVVNLGSVFGRTIYHKSVPKSQVKEDEAAWYERWTQSETYMSM